MSGFFGMYNHSKPGKGVSKDEPQKSGLFLYFVILFRQFIKIGIVNVLYVILSIPMYVLIFFISTYLTAWSAALSGVNVGGEVTSTISLIGLFASLVMLIVCGSGSVSSSMSYIFRRFVSREHSWVWSDFIDIVKRDFKRGIIVYLINIISVILFVVGYNFYSHIVSGSIGFVLKGIFVSMMFIFVIMQFYVYQIMAEYELSVKEIYKYSAILSIIKLPYNVIVAFVSIIFMYGVYSLTMSYPVVGFLFLLMFFYAFLEYTKIFMTKSIVDKYIYLLKKEDN